MKQRFTIEWDEPIYEEVAVTPPARRRSSRAIGKKRLRCDVVIEVDLERIAKVLGKKACHSKGKKSSDRFVTVKQTGVPFEIGRQLN